MSILANFAVFILNLGLIWRIAPNLVLIIIRIVIIGNSFMFHIGLSYTSNNKLWKLLVLNSVLGPLIFGSRYIRRYTIEI